MPRLDELAAKHFTGSTPTNGQPSLEDLATQHFQAPITAPSALEGISPRQPSPLSFGQHIILSAIHDDADKARYLAREFNGASVDRDAQGNLLVNGLRINPQGFGLEDVLEHATDILPLAGQFVGSLLGATAGSIVPGAGTTAGIVGGGAGGSALGGGVQALIGQIASGMSIDPIKLAGATAEQGIFGGTAEIGGIALSKASRPVLNRLASLWRGAMKTSGGFAPQVAEYIGGVELNATRMAQKHGFAETLRDEFFQPNKSQQIVKQTLFEAPDTPIERLGQPLTGYNGLQAGTQRLVQTIKRANNSMYDELVKMYSGLSDESLQTIRQTTLKELFDHQNFVDDRAYQVAGNIAEASLQYLKTLGEQVSKAESVAIRQAGGKTFAVTDIGANLNQLIRETGLMGGIKVEGFDIQPALRVPGGRELLEMRELLGSTVNYGPSKGRFAFFGSSVGAEQVKMPGLSMAQAASIRRRLDTLADAIFLNGRVPGSIKVATFDFVNQFRDKYFAELGLGAEAADYSLFKQFTDGIRLNRDTALASIENTVKGYRTTSGASRVALQSVVDKLPQGAALRQQILLQNTAAELRGVDIKQVANRFETSLTDRTMLDLTNNPLKEGFLRGVDASLKGNSRTAGLAFVDDAEKSLAAKTFLKGSPQLLRVLSVARLIGAGGALGYFTGGKGNIPGGVLAGGLAALALSNPRNIARLLVMLEQRSPGTILGGGLRSASPAVRTFASRAALAALLARTPQANPSATTQEPPLQTTTPSTPP